MAVTDQQKLDFLLKKIGFTKTKTGSVVGTGAISGTPKQPFAEAIPSPLIIANGALWNESDSIPTTPPGSDTAQVKVYLAGTSGLRLTADSTSSGQRAYIAYSTYGNASSTRLTNWIDTQFGSAYLIKVYKGDPNSGGVALSAAGSGSNDGWFFDYSAGVLNFNDTNVPSGVTDTNIYIVGYRYIGQTGAPTPTGGGNFTFNDLVVSRNFSVGGLSTFTGNIDANGIIEGIAGENKIPSLYANLGALPNPGTYHGMFAHVHSTGRGYFSHAGGWYELVNRESNGVVGTGTEAYNIGNINAVDGAFSGNVSIAGTLTYEDVKNVDAVGLITARSGIRVTGGVIEAQAGENKIPSLYSNLGALPNPGTYHGMFAHVHSTGRGYFSHAGGWYELVNVEGNGVVGTGTQRYNLGALVSTSTTATSLNVAGVSTFAGEIDANGRIVGAQLGNVIPFYYDNTSQFPSASTYHGAVAHAHNTGRLYFAHAGWKELVNVEPNGVVGTGTQRYNLGALVSTSTTATSLNVSGVTTAVTVDVNGDLDVDGHTNLDNVSIAGVTTFAGNIGGTATFNDIDVDGHTNLDNVSIAGVTTTGGLLDINAGGQANTFKVEDLTSGRVVIAGTGGELEDSNNLTFDGNSLFVSGINVTGGGSTSTLGADIVTRNLKATGLSTFVGQAEFDGNVKFDSTITAGGATGSNGQYLKTTGSGVEWASFPTMRTTQTFTASAGQTTFSFSYNIGFLDVFVNGVKLTPSEFTATNGSTVVLAVGCFVGDIVDVISYHTVSGGGGGGGGGISNVVEDTTPQLGGNLDLFNKSITGTGNVNITGIISATSFKGPSGVTATFVGDGSGLTNVIGSGSGVVVKDDNNVVGTAGTINFADNLSVTPISAGIVTVSADFSSSLVVSGSSSFTGITSIKNTAHFSYDSNADTQKKFWFWGNGSDRYVVFRRENINSPALNWSDNSRLTFGSNQHTDLIHSGSGFTWRQFTSANDNPFNIHSDFTSIKGSPTSSHDTRSIADFNYNDGTSLYHFGNKKLQTSGVGVTITSQLDVTNINASGVTTTTEVRSNALSLKNAAGSATYATFSNGGSALLKHNNTDRLETSASGVTVTGTVAATSYTGDGSQLTGVGNTTNVRTNTLEVVGVSTFAGITTVTGNNLFAKQLNVLGISTFNDIVDIKNLRLQTNGTGDFIESTSTGGLSIQSNYSVKIKQNGFPNRNYAIFSDGGASFYRGGNQTLSDTSNGWTFYNHIKPSADSTYDLGTNTDRFRNVYADTLYGDGSNLTNLPGGGSYGNNDVDNHLNVSGASSGQILSWNGSDYAWVADQTGGGGGTNVGITTNLSGSFTASAGTAATINTLTGYSANDLVVEYTIYIKNGSDFQSQKLLAMRDGTTIHSTQFAVMFSSSLLVQCDATISSGNILLRATPETGVSGSTTYKIKREVM